MRTVLALVLIAATLAACGGSGDDDSAPTATVAPAPAGVSISYLMAEGGYPGERASVTIRTDPVGVECDITYIAPDGVAVDAPGLEPGVTRGSGTLSWEWTISADTEPGTAHISVMCDGEIAKTTIEIEG